MTTRHVFVDETKQRGYFMEAASHHTAGMTALRATLRWDKQRLIEFTRAEDCRSTVRYEHRKGSAESLLAVPDAIAWCWAKGREWKTLVQPVVIGEREV